MNQEPCSGEITVGTRQQLDHVDQLGVGREGGVERLRPDARGVVDPERLVAAAATGEVLLLDLDLDGPAQFINKQGNLKGKKVQSLISQLSSPSASYREQYFVLTERHGGLGPGIWRRYRAKDAVSLAFALLDQKPTQDTSIDIHGLLLKEAEQRLPVLIQQKLDRLLG